MFKFNFIRENDEDNVEDKKVENLNVVFAESEEINANHFVGIFKNDSRNIQVKVLNTISNLSIKFVCPDSLVEVLKNRGSLNTDSILKAEQNHSDLLPTIYEGGLKVWECTYDLLNYFFKNDIKFKEKQVLDLGCGAGILGIGSLLSGADCWFQDYNVDVVQNITIPNVLLNCEEKLNNSRFFSGDWCSFLKLICKDYPGQKFDYIITSETIYNTSYYSKLHLVLEKLLKTDGVIFLAAKSFYFGVGGGIHLFREYLDIKKKFRHENCWQSTEGVKREILKIEFV